MAATYPPQVSMFEVVWNSRKGTGDTGDPGREPDLYPLEGVKVTFTPQLSPPKFHVPTGTPKVTIYQETVFAITNADGVLQIVDEVNEGVMLPWGFSPEINPTGWTWGVLIEPPGGVFPSSTTVIGGGPEGTIIDLADYDPVPPSGGEEIIAWMQARDDIEEARAQVIASQELLLQNINDHDFQGPQGLKGDKGNTGDIGPQGLPGDLTPIRPTIVNPIGIQTITPAWLASLTNVVIMGNSFGFEIGSGWPTDKTGTVTLIFSKGLPDNVTVTWPANIFWVEKVKPDTNDIAPLSFMAIHLLHLGGGNFLGVVMGRNFG